MKSATTKMPNNNGSISAPMSPAVLAYNNNTDTNG